MSSCLEVLKLGANDYDDGAADDDVPEDFDRQKFDRGRQFFQNHVISCLLAMMFSLVCGLSVSNLLDVLVETGKTSTPKDSINRYLRTTFHVLKWHYGDIFDKNTSAGRSVRSVGKIHNNTREFMIERRKDGSRDRDRTWVSHYDMSLVQCGFMGAIIMYPAQFGIRCSKRDLDDYVYFWRWVGYFLGMKDGNNICYGGYENAYKLCKEIEHSILLPAMKDPPRQFFQMANAFVDGNSQHLNVELISFEEIMILSFESMGKKWERPVKMTDRLRILFFKGLVNLLYYIPGLSWSLSKVCASVLGWSRMT